MDKAKENYNLGEVRIVNAEQIKKEYNKTISYEDKKFFCSNCGEYVTYVNKKKGKTFFRHIKETEETKACDLRIKSQQELSVYQKVGLPIYLKKNSNGNFSLFIGFYSINKNLMELSKIERASVTISGLKSNYNLSKKYFVDDNNFSCDITTLKQLNFLSPKYNIGYSGLKDKSLLVDKWGYEIEGISTNGALFKFEENGGRKIRINEEIIVDTDYLCISMDNSKFRRYSGITYEEVGSISIINGAYKVYKVRFSLRGWDNEAISEFCREIFKVSLVNKPSEIISMWPPTVNNGNKIEFVFEKNNLLLLKSSQSNAKAFIHRLKSYTEINLNKIDHNKYSFNVSPSTLERAININDEYNSKYLLVSNYREKFKAFSNEIVIKDIEYNVIEKGKYNRLPLEKKVMIFSNSEIDIIHYRQGIPFKSCKIKDKENIISDLKHEDRLVAKIGSKKNIIIEFEKLKEKTIKKSINDLEIYKKLARSNGQYDKVDIYTRNILKNLKDYPKTFNLVKSYVTKNKMPIGAKKILKEIDIK